MIQTENTRCFLQIILSAGPLFNPHFKNRPVLLIFSQTQREAMATSSSSLHTVFVYGSLLADEVVRLVLNRVPASSPAILNGYHRFSIKGRLYPAILPVESKKVMGRVLHGVTDPELNALDAFEDVEYNRGTVEISLIDNSEKLLAYAYIWGEKDDPDLYGDWDFEEWKKLHMKDFFAMAQSFVDEIAQPESKTRVQVFQGEMEQPEQKDNI